MEHFCTMTIEHRNNLASLQHIKLTRDARLFISSMTMTNSCATQDFPGFTGRL